MQRRTQIVKSIKDELKLTKESDGKELSILDIGPVRTDIQRNTREHVCDGLGGNASLALSDMVATEEELSVQVAQLDNVQVDHRDPTKATEHQVFKQLTSNAPSPHHKDPSRGWVYLFSGTCHFGVKTKYAFLIPNNDRD